MSRLLFVIAFSFVAGSKSYSQDNYILNISDFKHYIEEFNRNDNELYKQLIPNDLVWDFFESNIPFFECPDKNIEMTYYFRWWTFRKHIQKTPNGYVITEFLPKVGWSDKYNTISCAATHHFYEGRWLKSHDFLNGYANFWFTEGNPRQYNFGVANSFLEYFKVTKDSTIINLLPELVKNYRVHSWNTLK